MTDDDQSTHGRTYADSLHMRIGKHNSNMQVARPIYTQQSFDDGFDMKGKEGLSLSNIKSKIKKKFPRETLAPRAKKFALKFFPFIRIMKSYNIKDDAIPDLIAGLTVGIMNIPQAMGYALLASLPPIYGLYVSFFAPLIYFFFGTSKQLSLGTFAIISLMVGNAVESQADYCKAFARDAAGMTTVSQYMNFTDAEFTDSYNFTTPQLTGTSTTESPSKNPLNMCKIGIAGILTLMVGIIQFVFGMINFGFISIYLSDPLVSAFTCGSAFHVFTSQIKYAFGIKVGRFVGPFNLINTYIDIFKNIKYTTWGALIITCICIAVLLAIKMGVNERFKDKLKVPIPVDLVIVVVATVASYYGKFYENYKIEILKDIPAGFPTPTIPPMHKAQELIGQAITLAIVAFAINLSLSKIFAKKHNYEIDANQEFIAYGISNIVCSFFLCFTSGGALSRSAIQDVAGGRTQIAGLISGFLILVVLLAIGPYFVTLPISVLAAIIIVALKNLMLQLTELKRLWFISKYDFAIWLVTFLSVIILDVDIGLGVGVVFGLLTVVFRSQFPQVDVLGRIPHTDLYKDKKIYLSAQEVPAVKVIRVDTSLYYANVENFRKKLYKLTAVNPRKLRVARERIEKRVEREIKNGQREMTVLKKAAEKKLSVIQKMEEQPEDPVKLEQIEVLPANKRPEWPMPAAHHIIIDCVMMSYIDSVGVNSLKSIYQEYDAVGVSIYLANCQSFVRAMFKRCDLYATIPEENIYVAIHDAVLNALSLPETNDLLKRVKSDVQIVSRPGSVFDGHHPMDHLHVGHHLSDFQFHRRPSIKSHISDSDHGIKHRAAAHQDNSFEPNILVGDRHKLESAYQEHILQSEDKELKEVDEDARSSKSGSSSSNGWGEENLAYVDEQQNSKNMNI